MDNGAPVINEDLNPATLAEVMQALRAMSAQLDENTRITEEIRAGFPDGDPGGHRTYHEALIRREDERRKLYLEVRTHVAKGTVWAFVVGLGLWGWWTLKHFVPLAR